MRDRSALRANLARAPGGTCPARDRAHALTAPRGAGFPARVAYFEMFTGHDTIGLRGGTRARPRPPSGRGPGPHRTTRIRHRGRASGPEAAASHLDERKAPVVPRRVGPVPPGSPARGRATRAGAGRSPGRPLTTRLSALRARAPRRFGAARRGDREGTSENTHTWNCPAERY